LLLHYFYNATATMTPTRFLSSIRLLFCVFAFALLSFQGVCQGTTPRHYAYHSVYLYNFCKYTQWPDKKTEIVIGVLGNSPVYQGLLKMASTKSTYALKFTIKKFDTVADITNCNLLFLPITSQVDFTQLVQKIEGKNVLLVTENEKFIKQGSCINFISANGKLMFQLSQKRTSKSGLKISTKLTSLAILVD
jgi:YfiR/HmsC-like